MTRMDDPTPGNGQEGPRGRVGTGTFTQKLAKLALVGVIFGCVGIIVALLVPKPAYEGRLIGQIGHVHVYAGPSGPDEERLIVWQGRTKLAPIASDSPIQQFDLSSDDRQAAGTRHPDLVIDGWSGGMHCCLTRFVFDGPTGALIGKLALGSSGASRFVALPRTNPYTSAFLAFDDVTLDGQSLDLGIPLAPILLVWRGTKFGLYLEAMKATTADSPPPYLLNELFDDAQLELANDIVAEAKGARGDVAQALEQAAQARRAAMEAAVLNPKDPSSFAPVTAFLNDYVYKGQATAGFEAVAHAHRDQADQLKAALITYATQLRRSQWYDDLNRLNDWELAALLEQAETPGRQKP